MKLLRLILTILLGCCAASATDTYFAATSAGSNNGTNCANAYAITDGTHGMGTLTAGNTGHFCAGTYSASAGTSDYIKMSNSGTSGNPITLIADQGTATLTATYWSGEVINLNAQSYITVNGDNNLTIQATANGSGLANQQDNGECVGNGSPGTNASNVLVEGITCSNIYVDSSVSDNGGEDTYCFDIWNTSTLTIQNNVCHDAKWGIRNSFETGNTYSNVTIAGNNIYNMDHGYFAGDSSSSGAATVTNIFVYSNTLGSMVNWDNTADNNHHDWIHFNTNSTTSRFSSIFVYNNFASGDVGGNGNSGFFSFPAATAAMSGVYFFNNVYVNTSTTHCFADGFISWALAGTLTTVNNTFVSMDQGGSPVCTNNGSSLSGDNGIAYDDGSTGLVMENNIMETMENNFVYTANAGTSISTVDYQDYYTGGGWTWLGSSTATFNTWKSDCSCDSHAITTNPSLTGTYKLSTGSPAIAAGANLYSTCNGQANPGLGAMCLDASGNTRPNSAWDIGAYQYVNPAPAPAATMFVRAATFLPDVVN